MWRAVSLLLATSLVGVAEAACPASDAGLQGEIERGIAAYERFDWTSFEASLGMVREQVLCLREVLSPLTAARLHLLEALDAGRRKDEAAALAAFRGLISVLPEYDAQDGLIAPGSMLDRSLGQARALGEGPTRSLPGAGWTVDGRPGTLGYPTERYAVVQRTSGAGLHTWSLSGGPLPQDLAAMLATTPSGPTTTSTVAAEAERPPLRTLSALGLGVGSAACFLLIAQPSYQAWERNPTAIDPVDRALNHGAIIGGYALGIGAGGLLVSAAISGEW